MKLGQMISMDAGDFLPAELAAIMAQLREQAYRMPPKQLGDVLAREWGADWKSRLSAFDANPIAAASIGQVHRARLPDGTELAIKVQYPGVAQSIDADVDNVATLLRVSGLLPRELDLGPLLNEAKRQLHEEADYEREAGEMRRFADWLEDDARYHVPRPIEALTTSRILAMEFVAGEPIEALETAPQVIRDTAMRDLMALVLRELFEFGAMQTDPNFANYRYDRENERLVLLDFGAARDLKPDTAEGYRAILAAGLAEDRAAVRRATIAAGFLGEAAAERHGALVDRMIDIIVTEMNRPGPFDFGDRAFVSTLREQGMEMAADRATWHIPPVDTLFVQRKISGTALLAARLKARVDVRDLVRPYVTT
jgi:predicted unusual protein kinase regulating ubiquinone biosynthesis (AarF/ABC1/UbiB family)